MSTCASLSVCSIYCIFLFPLLFRSLWNDQVQFKGMKWERIQTVYSIHHSHSHKCNIRVLVCLFEWKPILCSNVSKYTISHLLFLLFSWKSVVNSTCIYNECMYCHRTTVATVHVYVQCSCRAISNLSSNCTPIPIPPFIIIIITRRFHRFHLSL